MVDTSKQFSEKRRQFLVKHFWLTSIIIISIITLAANYIITKRIDSTMLRAYSDINTSIVKSFVSNKLVKQDFTETMTPQRLKKLQSLFNDLKNRNTLKVKLWNKDGKIIYSTDESLIGKTFQKKASLKSALAGRADTEIVDTRVHPENKFDQKDFLKAVETYIPVKPPDSKRVEGAFEIYFNLEPLIKTVNQENIVVLPGLVIFYLILLMIIRLASSMLIKQNRRLEDFSKLMEEKALTDDLTGLYNRRFFDPKLEEEAHRSSRYNRPLSIIMLDIDHFKWINDQLGHKIGDEVLTKTAALIKANLRRVDIAARLGGDEFAIIMPETEGENAMIVAERLRKAYQTILKQYRSENLPLTISNGVAEYPSSARTIEDLMAAADKALYHSKNNGRNQSSFYNKIAKQAKVS